MTAGLQERVLLLALRGRDAEVIATLLKREGQDCLICRDADALARAMKEGAGLAIVTEESLPSEASTLFAGLEDQPAWSDFPIILLATKRTGRRPAPAQATLTALGNVVVLERPIHGETLTSAVAAALRGRRRQYEAWRHLDALTAAEERLMDLNTNLERLISDRTAELSAANNRLVREIHDRELAQAALAQSQKMEAVGQLTGGIAHDFNNLLTVITGNLDLIRRRTVEDRTARLAGYAQEAAGRAAKLTQQLLAFSRTQRLNLEPVPLNAMISGMRDMLNRSIGPRVSIRLDLDVSAPWALADTNQLELAVLNLSINARDAMPDGGVLTIGTSASTPDAGLGLPSCPHARIAVADTGSGIAPHLLTRIFDPFFTTKPVGKGTGLGLSQVYGIAQQSGGTVTVDSAQGQGTTITIWLPLTAPTDVEAAVSPSSDHALRAGKILVIDDDDGVRRFIVETLETSGYGVRDAAAGPDGLAVLQGWQADLVIVDYAMPGMSGAEFGRAARREQPDLPILLATGYADMGAVEAVFDRSSVLEKPFRVEDLLGAVRRALRAPGVSA